MTENKRNGHCHHSQTCCVGDLRSNHITGRFLLRISSYRIQFLSDEHNVNGIPDMCHFDLDWMENSEKINKVIARV